MTGDGRHLQPVTRIAGRLQVPGDKSISHRALIIASVARGTSRLAGLNPGDDVAATRSALERLGARIGNHGDAVVVEGSGFEGLDARDGATRHIDCGNSGTTARLLLGLLAGRRADVELTGDESLSRRPMGRVAEPLREMGAAIDGGERLPLRVRGRPLRGADLSTGGPSAQVKGALLLAALQAHGSSRIAEPRRTRDHTERLLAAAGARIEPDGRGGTSWTVTGGALRLRPLELSVPGDPSCAAPLVALACAIPGSRLSVEDVSLNPSRLGFFELLRRMGADVEWTASGEGVEPRGRLEVRGRPLEGIEVREDDVSAAIDEVPLLAVVASVARGRTVIGGAAELRVKESDRIAATASLLRAFGATCEERAEGLVVEGGGRLAPASVDAQGDHRMAMCAAVAAALATEPTVLTGHACVRVSYPGFFEDLERLSA